MSKHIVRTAAFSGSVSGVFGPNIERCLVILQAKSDIWFFFSPRTIEWNEETWAYLGHSTAPGKSIRVCIILHVLGSQQDCIFCFSGPRVNNYYECISHLSFISWITVNVWAVCVHMLCANGAFFLSAPPPCKQKEVAGPQASAAVWLLFHDAPSLSLNLKQVCINIVFLRHVISYLKPKEARWKDCFYLKHI